MVSDDTLVTQGNKRILENTDGESLDNCKNQRMINATHCSESNSSRLSEFQCRLPNSSLISTKDLTSGATDKWSSQVVKGSSFFMRSKRERENHLTNQGLVTSLAGAGGRPVRRLLVKHRTEDVSKSDWIDARMAQLEAAVLDIQAERAMSNDSKVSYSLETLYQSVEQLCTHNYANVLYGNLVKLIKSHVDSILVPVIKNARPVGPDASDLNTLSTFLTKVDDVWRHNCRIQSLIVSIFSYLDRAHVLSDATLIPLWEVGLEAFRVGLIQDDAIQPLIITGVLSLIQADRNGQFSQSDNCPMMLVKSILSMMLSLGLFSTDFEPKFFDSTRQVYGAEARVKLALGPSAEDERLTSTIGTLDPSDNVSSYLAHVKIRIDAEQGRAVNCLHLDPIAQAKLISIVETEMVGRHIPILLDRGLKTMLDANDITGLSLLYRLLSRIKGNENAPSTFAVSDSAELSSVNGISQMCKAYGEYVKATGTQLVIDPAQDSTMVQSLLDFKTRLDSIITSCFTDDYSFVSQTRESFEVFINRRHNRPAELIAKFIDHRLRSGNKEATDEALDKLLDELMMLFRFIQGKDMFEAFYKRDLAKRLLVGRSASIDAEKAMLAKLKSECGAAFTSKLEGMFKDMDVAADVNLAFKAFSSSLTRTNRADDVNEEEGDQAKDSAKLIQLRTRAAVKASVTSGKSVKSGSKDGSTVDTKSEKETDAAVAKRRLTDEAKKLATKIDSLVPTAGPIDLTVSVLSMAYWPSQQQTKQFSTSSGSLDNSATTTRHVVDLKQATSSSGSGPSNAASIARCVTVKLPNYLDWHLQLFEKFYASKYSGRRIEWQPHLGHVVLRAQFDGGPKEFKVSLYQAVVLLQFNTEDTISYKSISESTRIDACELKRVLQSLACGKVRVLSKLPKGRDVEDEDQFAFNSSFSHPLFHIKINQVQLRETVEEQQATEERVFQDRQLQLDAAIVRIMKTRKTSSHTLLVSELLSMIGSAFPVRASDVKRRIESLIDRDYMARDADNPNQYNYVA